MTNRLPARIDDLPTSLIDIAEAIGMRAAIGLIENFGGLDVKFPQKPKPDHPVIKALGETDGYALCQYLGGQALYVPHNRTGSARDDILKLQAKGKDRAEIARELGISERHVRRMANRTDDPRQRRLFD